MLPRFNMRSLEAVFSRNEPSVAHEPSSIAQPPVFLIGRFGKGFDNSLGSVAK
jgi:hypothetical protein